MIRPQMFSGGALPLADPGEVIFQSAGASNSQTVFNWVVPAGVYEVCMLGVSSHKAYATRVSRGGNDLLNTTWASGTNNAHGGDGGDARNVNTVYNGGGGAGGYSGPGGLGMYQRDEGMGNYSLIKGTDGQGGGGGRWWRRTNIPGPRWRGRHLRDWREWRGRLDLHTRLSGRDWKRQRPLSCRSGHFAQ
ncbi:hypothetical protein [Paracidovorax avenae]|uniref:hypothetical protein n=1 Tax=Paracidovorax avenae TaxID=80867 RepID=UPI00126025EE|nr:hypothetical protein [Paracidovorax avenae]